MKLNFIFFYYPFPAIACLYRAHICGVVPLSVPFAQDPKYELYCLDNSSLINLPTV